MKKLKKIKPYQEVVYCVPMDYKLEKGEKEKVKDYHDSFSMPCVYHDSQGNQLREIIRIAPLTVAELKINEIIDTLVSRAEEGKK